MSAIPSIGLAELVTLIGVTGLACSVPLIGALVLVVVALRQKGAHPARQE